MLQLLLTPLVFNEDILNEEQSFPPVGISLVWVGEERWMSGDAVNPLLLTLFVIYSTYSAG